ncbi:hydroxylacyl-CoA dehydrogenase [Brevibacterium sp. 5221]|uniref:Hydroxylacyl-CoA dehydrogenase n=1 Tax=Brevibacterium rongguiense TaxID=2695267 RepID=A0A6N9H573_9MICO|nr:3-hydroxyacyl-CoA dehydrogenase NAD-binding domain-containing protein [Brevibacterium rongguiense]MYM19069.1 hydroxylacyl-CoA dehydrogenase [Brevibacterium rongguiense]
MSEDPRGPDPRPEATSAPTDGGGSFAFDPALDPPVPDPQEGDPAGQAAGPGGDACPVGDERGAGGISGDRVHTGGAAADSAPAGQGHEDVRALLETGRAAVIGAGLIGLSWARLFASCGLDVRIADPRPDLEAAVEALRESLAVQAGEGTGSIELAQSVGEALDGAGLVQESGPERPELKAQLFADIAEAAPRDALLASSSSAIPATQLAKRLDDAAAARILIAHPFNPPHLMPLVEIVPGERTAPEAVARARAIYAALGREPVVLEREMHGFIGNRLQNAVLREAAYLVQQGVAGVEDIDRAVTNSLGVRWAAVGPLEGMHLGGGEAGLAGFMEHIGPSFAAIEEAAPDMSEAGMKPVVEQAVAAYGLPPRPELAARRDRIQAGVLDVRAAQARAESPAEAQHAEAERLEAQQPGERSRGAHSPEEQE